METKQRKVGRPKAPAQTGPLVLSERRKRTKIEIEVGTEAAEELAEYVRWVEMSEGMSTADARAETVEFALRNVFKRDRLWRQHRSRRDQTITSSGPAPSTAPAASNGSTRPAGSLPLPSGTSGASRSGA